MVTSDRSSLLFFYLCLVVSEREDSSDELGLKDVFHQTSEVHYTPPELTIQLQTSENLYLSCLLLSSVNEKIVRQSLQKGKEFRHNFHIMQLYFGQSFVTYTYRIKTVQYFAFFFHLKLTSSQESTPSTFVLFSNMYLDTKKFWNVQRDFKCKAPNRLVSRGFAFASAERVRACSQATTEQSKKISIQCKTATETINAKRNSRINNKRSGR